MNRLQLRIMFRLFSFIVIVSEYEFMNYAALMVIYEKKVEEVISKIVFLEISIEILNVEY